MKFNNIILGFIYSAQSGYAQEDQQQVTFTGKEGDECNTISECEPSFKCVRTVTDFQVKFICSSPDSTDAPIVKRPITFIGKEGDLCGKFLKCESPLECSFDISILIGGKELKQPLRSTGTSCVHICQNTDFIDVCLVGETCSGSDETGECVGTSASTPTPVPSIKAPTNETCTAYAYDDTRYCKCPAPVPHYANRDKMEVSVCGDATYLLDYEITPCSGNSDVDPAGTGCPKKNAETTLACRENILSYFAGDSSGICSAPEDAMCEKLNTGAWGCVFPGNANTVNTCVDVHPVSEYYKVDAEGKTMAGENGYPLLTDVAYQKQMVDIDTTTLTTLFQKEKTTSSDTPVMMWSTLAIMTGLSILGFATM